MYQFELYHPIFDGVVVDATNVVSLARAEVVRDIGQRPGRVG
jgi:hypothetical protein